MNIESRKSLLIRGVALAEEFCRRNEKPMPAVVVKPAAEWRFSVCAYYRPDPGIVISVEKCATIGTAGRQWSFPGFSVDRTPYGVIAHELGHHMDFMAGTRKGAYWSEYGAGIAASTREEALSGYCPNSAEWFAEMFRLFVTNPDLLSYIRPRTFSALARDGWKPAVDEDWQTVLANAPGRTYDACEKKVMLAAKKIGLG